MSHMTRQNEGNHQWGHVHRGVCVTRPTPKCLQACGMAVGVDMWGNLPSLRCVNCLK